MKVISVLLVDDHTLFRQGLASVLKDRPNYQVVGHAANGLEAIDLARQLMPDLILMDVHMPVLNGLEATRQIKREMPDVRIVMLTMSEDDQNLFEAIKSGAQGYLLKNTAADELFRFMEGVLEGEASVSGVMAAKMLGEFRKPKTISSEVTGNEQLTDREREVLSHVAEGLSNREIAANLQISENTIKKHLRNILAKLQLENRVQAALYAKSRS
ncbi:MAG: DNA-binding response regulator [Chloroflexi bacterium RBG_16_56_8]|nr:MAG: DNA-binding response regulator [Chloroflexi bacterium RBG_16_56_8]